MTLPVMWNWGCFLGAFFGVTVRLVREPAAGHGLCNENIDNNNTCRLGQANSGSRRL